jgi:hypothetical protein
MSVITKQAYQVEPILKLVPKCTTIDGDLVRLNSARLLTFKVKGVKCVCCGLEGSFFLKSIDRSIDAKGQPIPHPGIWYVNLYAVNPTGGRILMTMDHILPKSLGGETHVKNLQPMCAPCNQQKAATLGFAFQLWGWKVYARIILKRLRRWLRELEDKLTEE